MTDTYAIALDQEIKSLETAPDFQDSVPSISLTKKELVDLHVNNVSLLRSGPRLGEPKSLVLPAAYSPSTKSFNDLQKIQLSDLKVEIHHWGNFITARTVTPPYVTDKVITIIEDEDGNVAKLEICFQDPSSSDSDLPLNSTIAVKEPYYKRNGHGDYAIHVDHPSDIAVLRGDDPAISMIMEVVSKTKDITAAEWRAAGDKAYLEKRYPSAVECYTQAIDNTKDDDSAKRDTYRKRAYANLVSKRFDSALKDALDSCAGDNLDDKAFHCAGKAAYALGLYNEALDYIGKALKAKPKDLKYGKDFKQVQIRIEEQNDGLYDFKAMGESLNDYHVHLDHANFTNNTTMAFTESKGRGLFATKFIPRGSLVLCEKALHFPNLSDSDRTQDNIIYNFNTRTRTKSVGQSALFMGLIQKLYNDPGLASKFYNLDGGNYIRTGKEGCIVDGVPVIDVFLIEAIRLKNGFSYVETYMRQDDDAKKMKKNLGGKGELQAGLWLRASLINHSCIPNCARSFVGDIMILRATCDIPKGTELTQHYTSPEASFKTRQEMFMNNWEFDCSCPLCASERKSPFAKHEERIEVVHQIRAEATKHPRNHRVPEASIRNIERLYKKAESLHEPEIYSAIPRLLLVHPAIWLTEATRTKRNFARTAKYALETLRNFGFVEPLRDGQLTLDYERGIVNSESFNALQYAMDAYKELGQLKLSKRCEIEARKMFGIITGDNEGVDAALMGDD